MPIDDDAVCMAILFSSFKNMVPRRVPAPDLRIDQGRSYAAGGPREEMADSSTWWAGSKSGAGASQTTRKTGVTVAVTVVRRKGSGPT
jgi:hypothetical protein